MLIPIAAQRPIISNVVLMVEVTALRAYANFLIARVSKVATAFSGSPLDAVSICLVEIYKKELGSHISVLIPTITAIAKVRSYCYNECMQYV